MSRTIWLISWLINWLNCHDIRICHQKIVSFYFNVFLSVKLFNVTVHRENHRVNFSTACLLGSWWPNFSDNCLWGMYYPRFTFNLARVITIRLHMRNQIGIILRLQMNKIDNFVQILRIMIIFSITVFSKIVWLSDGLFPKFRRMNLFVVW